MMCSFTLDFDFDELKCSWCGCGYVIKTNVQYCKQWQHVLHGSIIIHF